MSVRFQLILGTHNRKKRLELEQLLQFLPIQLSILEDFPNALEVEETGETFAENAALKASTQARHLEGWVLAEDSGLSVAALNGDPGVYSARYAGHPSNDELNNQKLITELKRVPEGQRTAWYTCHACLADPSGNIVASVFGHCYGRILLERRGQSGFGYDPYFELREYHQTFAELGLTVKSVISHRARAMRKMLPYLQNAVRQSRNSGV